MKPRLRKVPLLTAVVSAVVVSLGAPAHASAPSAAPAAAPVTVGQSAATYGGVNDRNCTPSASNPEPVVLLHGLGGPSTVNFAVLGERLAQEGHCVFYKTFGKRLLMPGFESMPKTAKQVSTYIDDVRRWTGSDKVDIVGHSMGTTVGAWYMKFLDGDQKVNDYVGVAPNYKGTTLHGLNKLADALPLPRDFVEKAVCASCVEFLPPNDFLTKLGEGGVSVPGPNYTNIMSSADQVVVPYTSGELKETGVENIVMQEECSGKWLVGHLLMVIDKDAANLVDWALQGKSGPRPAC